jgi:hypothetical protein
MKERLVFVEVDYYDVVSKKIQIIKAKQELSNHLTPVIEETELLLNTSNYKIIASDLRDTEGLSTKFLKAGVNPNIPTLIVTECVLVYLKT